MKRKKSNWDKIEPQKSSAAQFITYVASVGNVDEKYEIRYEDKNIWMSQKMLAQVYGVEIHNIAYHLRKIFEDAELEKNSVIKEILIVALNGAPRRVESAFLRRADREYRLGVPSRILRRDSRGRCRGRGSSSLRRIYARQDPADAQNQR